MYFTYFKTPLYNYSLRLSQTFKNLEKLIALKIAAKLAFQVLLQFTGSIERLVRGVSHQSDSPIR